MVELRMLIEGNLSLDEKMEVLKNKIQTDVKDFTEIEKIKKEITIDVDKLFQLQKKIILLSDNAYNDNKNK